MPTHLGIKPCLNQKPVIHRSKENTFDLIHQGKFESVGNQIEKKEISADLRHEKSQTLLEYAHIYRQDKIVELLISKGATLQPTQLTITTNHYGIGGDNIEDGTTYVDNQYQKKLASETSGRSAKSL